MDDTHLEFQNGQANWDPVRDSVRFAGISGVHMICFYVTSEALAEMVNPDMGHLSGEQAIDAFFEFEIDIHRIAQREFHKLGATETDEIMLTREMVAP